MSSRIQILATIALLIGLGFAETAVAQRSLLPSLGGSRSGTSGFQFLKVNVDARSSGMGNSNVADASGGSSLYWNPALAVQGEGSQLYLGHTAYFADVSLNYASYIHKFRNMAVGASLTYLDSGEMNETTEFQPFGTGRTFRTVHLAAGLSFSQELTNLFSYGLTLKYLDERIEEVEVSNIVVDLGFFYRVGDTGLRFAIGLTNFGVDATPGGETTRLTLEDEQVMTEFEDVSPPTNFILGAAYDAYQGESVNVLVTGQLTNPSDDAEKMSIGAEMGYIRQFFVRAGYQFGVDEVQYPNFGVGFRLPVAGRSLELDYGFAARERLGNIHRLAVKFNL
ncbi:MAG: PorV/PorQ family protein [Rhodothermaceae bacterium]|nr:PorV/PorQ family protein [Rhodothermaceae bacterium]